MKEYIRVWKEVDIDELEQHLLIVGDLHGDCAHCKEIGLDFSSVTTCPRCQTAFKYISPRGGSGQSDHRFHEIKRMMTKRPDLLVVDYDDYKRISGRNKAKKFFE